MSDELLDAAYRMFFHAFERGVKKDPEPPTIKEDVFPHAVQKSGQNVQNIIADTNANSVEEIREGMVCSYAAGVYAAGLARQTEDKTVTKQIFDSAWKRIKEQWGGTEAGGPICRQV